jgi:hypothetical protein
LPDVVNNFLYKNPKTMFHKIISITAAKEITIAHSLYRNFNWYENILWLDDISSEIKVIVSLSHGDEIIPTNAIIEYLSSKNVQIITFDNFSHLQSISSSNIAIDKIYKHIE